MPALQMKDKPMLNPLHPQELARNLVGARPIIEELMWSYSEVPRFNEWEEKQKELDGVNAEESALWSRPLGTEDRDAQLREGFKAHKARRHNYLRRYFTDPKTGGFKYFTGDTLNGEHFPIYVDEDEFEEMVRSLPPVKDGISVKEREKKSREYAEKRQALQIRLNSLACPYIQIVGKDWRAAFVEYWRSLQARTDEPVGPLGRPLDESDEVERKAWSDLGLKKLVNGEARFRPYRQRSA